MGPVLASVVAVFGTLTGSALTFFFQRHAARRAERFARTQQLWQERTAAYSTFVAALTDFRRSQNDRWHLEHADPQSPEFIAARAESYELRANSTSVLCRVRLISGSNEIGQLAQNALDVATEVHLAQDEQDRSGRGEKARLAVDRFVLEASAQVLSDSTF
jgi:hypothetical protein